MMIKLTDLLTEAPINQSKVDDIIKGKKRVSIYYQGDSVIPKGWYKIEAIASEEIEGKPRLLAFDVTQRSGNSAELKYFDQSKIVNLNLLSSIFAKLASDVLKKGESAIKKLKDKLKPKIGKETVVTTPSGKIQNTTGAGSPKDKLEDAIKNKNVVTITYNEIRNKKDKTRKKKGEKPTRFITSRATIKPVAMGYRKVRTKEDGTRDDQVSEVWYVRAWQVGETTQTIEPAWKLFRVDRIKTVEIKGTENFGLDKDEKGEIGPPGNKDRGKFKYDDKFMDTVKYQSDFGELGEGSLSKSILEAIEIF
jgi:hypothetical protein